MGEDAMPVGQLDPKHRVRQQLDDRALYFNCVFARHVKISGSSFVINTVCSKCAEGIPSAAPAVQPLSSRMTDSVPALIIGSIAHVIPGLRFCPLPRPPYVGIFG